jgi:hypothetical protein
MTVVRLVKDKQELVDTTYEYMVRFTTKHITQCQVVLTQKDSELAT